jgi:hypothetical protein
MDLANVYETGDDGGMWSSADPLRKLFSLTSDEHFGFKDPDLKRDQSKWLLLRTRKSEPGDFWITITSLRYLLHRGPRWPFLTSPLAPRGELGPQG